VSHVKRNYPDNQVRVNIDLKNLGLKVGRRPPAVDGHPADWKDYTRLIALPPEVFDVSARTIPENFKVSDLPDTPVKQVPMQTDSAPTSSPAGRLSRKDSQEGVPTPSKRLF